MVVVVAVVVEVVAAVVGVAVVGAAVVGTAVLPVVAILVVEVVVVAEASAVVAVVLFAPPVAPPAHQLELKQATAESNSGCDAVSSRPYSALHKEAQCLKSISSSPMHWLVVVPVRKQLNALPQVSSA